MGLKFYLTPKFEKLGNMEVWVAAASQIFYSTGVGWGTLVAFASYNEKSHNFLRDAWLVPLINCGTSFLAGLVVFSVLGFMATQAGVTVEELRMQGSGLAFVAYPQALSQMPGAQFFSVMFFVMVVCLGVDSQFAMVETVLTALNDAQLFPRLSKPLKAAIVCFLMCIIGLLFVTRAGLHWLDIFNTFAVNVTLFLVGGLECIAVGWVYGTDKMVADVSQMTKKGIPKLLLWDIKYLIPFLLLILTLWTLVTSIQGGYAFPPAGVVCGWILSSFSLAPLFYMLIRHSGDCLNRVRERLGYGGRGGGGGSERSVELQGYGSGASNGHSNGASVKQHSRASGKNAVPSEVKLNDGEQQSGYGSLGDDAVVVRATPSSPPVTPAPTQAGNTPGATPQKVVIDMSE